MEALLNVIVYLVVLGVFFGLLWWLVGYLQLPEPFNKIVRVFIGLAAFLACAWVLFALLGGAWRITPLPFPR